MLISKSLQKLAHGVIGVSLLIAGASTDLHAQTNESDALPTMSTKAEAEKNYWDTLMTSVWPRVSSYFYTNSSAIKSYEFNQSEKSSDYDFDRLMDAAGFKIKEVETGFGVYPVFSLTFGHARELSNADIVYINRLLRKQRIAKGSPKSYIERQIVEFVVQSEFFLGSKYTIEKVEVELLPLPKVKFIAQPKDKPNSDDTEVILRAIDRLNTRIQQANTTIAN